MKKYIAILLLIFSFLQINAQCIADLWISMPNEKVPYLTLNQRKEMIECHKIGVETSVKNKFEGTCLIDTLSSDYALFTLSSVKSMQLIRLPMESADSILCCISHYATPVMQSTMEFYDLNWDKLILEDKLPAILAASLVQRPDSMSVEKYEELFKSLSPKIFHYYFNPSTKELEIELSVPLTFEHEKVQLEAIMCKRRLKWVGGMFK